MIKPALHEHVVEPHNDSVFALQSIHDIPEVLVEGYLLAGHPHQPEFVVVPPLDVVNPETHVQLVDPAGETELLGQAVQLAAVVGGVRLKVLTAQMQLFPLPATEVRPSAHLVHAPALV